jgi:hypothetical protein
MFIPYPCYRYFPLLAWAKARGGGIRVKYTSLCICYVLQVMVDRPFITYAGEGPRFGCAPGRLVFSFSYHMELRMIAE